MQLPPHRGLTTLARALKTGFDDSLRPTLFLDLDDVLCTNRPYGGYDVLSPATEQPPDLWQRLWNPDSVAVLKAVLARFDPQIVLTTSWLRFLDRDGFASLFWRTGLNEIVDALHPDGDAPQESGRTRHDAITKWLSANYKGERFVVLDDAMSGTGLLGSNLSKSGRLVLCTVGTGLTQPDLAVIERALRPKVSRPSSTATPYPLYKCSACGWVHTALPRPVAEASVAEALAHSRALGEPETERLSRYSQCFRCSQPTSQFVPALDTDAPTGCTLQSCLLP